MCFSLTMREIFENADFCSPVRPGPSTIILHENWTFRKRSSNRANLKMPALWEKIKTELHVNSLNEFCSVINPASLMIVAKCGRKTFDAFPTEWDLRPHIPLAWCGRVPILLNTSRINYYKKDILICIYAVTDNSHSILEIVRPWSLN